MKRLMAVLMTLALLAGTALPSMAAGRKYARRSHSAHATQRVSSDSATYSESQRDGRSFWEKHRDKLTVAGGALGGAILGGMLGGKKGAAVGILAGGAGAGVYTYKIRKKDRSY